MKQKRELSLAEVLPGMTLAASVIDAQGRVLVPAGAELNESLLQALARREVALITVDCEVEEDPAEREARHARVMADLEARFRLAGDSPEVRLLQQTLFDFLKDQR